MNDPLTGKPRPPYHIAVGGAYAAHLDALRITDPDTGEPMSDERAWAIVRFVFSDEVTYNHPKRDRVDLIIHLRSVKS